MRILHPCPQKSRPVCVLRGTAGFTLIEIMVVVIVLAILAGMMMPSLGGSLETVRLNAAANRVSDLFDYCHQAATATGRVHGLVFAGDGIHYQMIAEARPKKDEAGKSGDAGEAEKKPKLEPFKLPGVFETRLPEGVKLTSFESLEQEQGPDGAGEGSATRDQSAEPSGAPGDGARILFFPDGTAEFATLVLGTARGDRRTIRLNGLSGAVRIAGPEDSRAGGRKGMMRDAQSSQDPQKNEMQRKMGRGF